MELVGDDASIWEVFFGELFKWVTEVEDDVTDVFSPLYMVEIPLKSSSSFSVHDFFDSSVIVVDEDSCELSVPLVFIAFEGVFIDANGFWPGVVFDFSVF